MNRNIIDDRKITQVEGDPELKAYIYQQVNEMQAWLPQNTQVAVVVSQVTRKKTQRSRFEVSMITQLGEQTFEFKSHDKDLYTAVGKAKEAMLFQLSENQDDRERSARIQNYASGNHLLH